MCESGFEFTGVFKFWKYLCAVSRCQWVCEWICVKWFLNCLCVYVCVCVCVCVCVRDSMEVRECEYVFFFFLTCLKASCLVLFSSSYLSFHWLSSVSSFSMLLLRACLSLNRRRQEHIGSYVICENRSTFHQPPHGLFFNLICFQHTHTHTHQWHQVSGQ